MHRSLLSAFVVVVVLPVVPGCFGFATSQCGPYDEPVVDAGITQGIAGYSARNEICMPPAVCGCRPFDASFDVYPVGDAVLVDDAAAQRFIDGVAPIRVTVGADRHEQALDVGRYIACVNTIDDAFDAHGCLDFYVEPDRITTLHVVDSGEGSVPRLGILYGDDQPRDAPRVFVIDRTLPSLADAADADAHDDDDAAEPATAPTFCEWATSLDTLVTATVVGVEPLTDVDGEACVGEVVPGLLLHLELQERLRGEGVTPSFDVRVGAEHAALFANGGTLDVGETIGVPLHQVVDDDGVAHWSLLGERLFAPFRGHLSFQRGADDRIAPAPVGIEELSWYELNTAVDACRNLEPGAQRRRDQREAWGPHGAPPSAYMAAQCTDPISE